MADEYRGGQFAHNCSHIVCVVSEAQAFQLPMIGSRLVMSQPHGVRLIALRGQIRAKLVPDMRPNPYAMNSKKRLWRFEISRWPVERLERTNVDCAHLIYGTQRFSVLCGGRPACIPVTIGQ